MNFVRFGKQSVNLDLAEALELTRQVIVRGQDADDWRALMDEFVPPAPEPEPSSKTRRDRPPML